MAKVISYDISKFDDVKRVMEEKREEQRKKALSEAAAKVAPEDERKVEIDGGHGLTEEQIAEAKAFKEENQAERSGTKVRSVKKTDMVSGVVYTLKPEDIATDELTLIECKNIRDELIQRKAYASSYTKELFEAMAPDLLEEDKKEIYDAFVDFCGSISKYDLANITLEEAEEVFKDVMPLTLFAPMNESLREMIKAFPEDSSDRKDSEKQLLEQYRDIIEKVKVTVTVQIGVDSVIPIVTNYMNALLAVLKVNPKEGREDVVEDEIYQILLSIDAGRECINRLIIDESIEFDLSQLQSELNYINELKGLFTEVNDFVKINDYVSSIGRKLKIDMKKEKMVTQSVTKMCSSMITSPRRYPIPGTVNTAKEVQGILIEFLSSTLLAYDFGEFYIEKMGITGWNENWMNDADLVKEFFNEYDSKQGCLIGEKKYDERSIELIKMSKELVFRIYAVNQEDPISPDKSFNQILASLMPKRYEYYRKRSLDLLYILSKVYTRAGRVEDHKEHELIVLLDIIAKANYGENARRISTLYRNLDELRI